MKGLFFLFFLFCTPLYPEDWVDLEADPSPFVLEVRKLDIPGHPHAFNPSIVSFQGQYLLSFRIIPDRKNSYTTYLGLVRLDKNFDCIGDPQIISTRPTDSSVPSRAEDGRLIWVGHRLYIIYDDNEDKVIGKSGFRLFIGEVHFNGEKFSIREIEKITKYEGADPNLREKAWTPFVYDKNLLLSYSIVPHKIFSPWIGRGFCKTVAESKSEVNWPYGIIRGGTSALKGVADKDEYLSIFHSSMPMESKQSEGKRMLHYFMGAFTFSSEPPFELTRISAKPIIGKQFYSGTTHKPYWHPLRVVFPVGYVFDDSYIYVVYGRQDHEIWVAKLDKAGLVNSLIPVQRCPSP